MQATATSAISRLRNMARVITHEPSTATRPAPALERMLSPIHRWIWSNPRRRVQKLLRFSATEIDGGRDILRASEVTSDPLLRRLYMLHAVDENRHGALFRRRAAALLRVERHAEPASFESDWFAPAAGHGLDD